MPARSSSQRLQLSDQLAAALGWKKHTAVPLEEIIARLREHTRPVPEHLNGAYMVSSGWETCATCGGSGRDKVEVTLIESDGRPVKRHPRCPGCNGSGQTVWESRRKI